ncbi:MAG: hypothetical protein JSW51_13385 [Gemmatimonadota bacterium]|nr:MAG: hypothetical protein JSW51_13385 [Gemmatimonadota bacterium]
MPTWLFQSRQSRRRRVLVDQRGFALPLSILVITVTTLMLTAAFVRAAADHDTADSAASTVKALAIARTGLERYIAIYDSINVRPLDGDSLRINVSGGFADVIAHQVQVPANALQPHTYVVRSRGTAIEPTRGSDPQAVRTVAQFANWVPAGFSTVAAHTALNGVKFAPESEHVIDGNDQCSGLAVMGYRGPWTSDVPAGTSGSPPDSVAGTWPQIAVKLGIDWSQIVNGDFEADHAAVIAGDTTFATYRIEGNASLTDITGTGLLMVTGNLDLHGARIEWDGAVLIGGRLHPDADTTIIRGMLVSGLNFQVGEFPNKNELSHEDENLYIHFNSCTLHRALDRYTGFSPVAGTWIDNWAMY